MAESNRAHIDQLNQAIEELEKQSVELRDLNSAYSEIASLKNEIRNSLELLQENNAGLSNISAAIDTTLEGFQKKVDEMYKDNKAFQKELDASIATRMDKHKSDIQIEIRNEGAQIQRALETTLNSNFNQLDSRMKDAFEQQAKQFNILKVLLAVLMVLTTGAVVGLVLLNIK